MRHFLLLAALAAASPAIAAARPVVLTSRDSLLIFRAAWPDAAAAVPAIDRRFRTEATQARAKALVIARGDRTSRGKSEFPFHAHEYLREWKTVGRSTGLLSLQSQTYIFTGGAHGMTVSGFLLWDRSAARATTVEALLLPGRGWAGAIRGPFCILLDRERARRRQAPVKQGGVFSDCPANKELQVGIVDSDGDGRFDHVRAVADQYVAGSYAEGIYSIDLPITATMRSRLRAEARASFRAQPPVQ